MKIRRWCRPVTRWFHTVRDLCAKERAKRGHGVDDKHAPTVPRIVSKYGSGQLREQLDQRSRGVGPAALI